MMMLPTPPLRMLCPELAHRAPGVLTPTMLRRDGDRWTADGPALHPLTVCMFARHVVEHVPADATLVTIGGRVINDPVPAGEWVRCAPEDGVRFVAVVADPGPWPDLGVEFALGAIIPTGMIAEFDQETHRRPAVTGRVRRVYLSASAYRPGQLPNLSSVLLEGLR